MKPRHTQRGATLVVSLIMLVVLTLLAVSAIRFGLVNLKIATNVQVETEAEGAAQKAIEEIIQDQIANPAIDLSVIGTPADKTITMGGVDYTVRFSALECKFSTPVPEDELKTDDADDIPCFEEADKDVVCFLPGPGNKPCPQLSACNRQQWELKASVQDTDNTGIDLTLTQGLSIRVPAQVSCGVSPS